MGPASYAVKGATLAPRVGANLPRVSLADAVRGGLRPTSSPLGSNDTQYRHRPAPRLRGRAAGSRTEGEAQLLQYVLTPGEKVIGTFDPAELKQFSRLSKVPLQTFYPPTVSAAGADSAPLLHGKPLGPTSNGAGYLTQPPLILTTIQGPSSRVAPKQVLTVCHLPRSRPRCRRARVLAQVLRVLAIPTLGMPSRLQLPAPVPCGRVRT